VRLLLDAESFREISRRRREKRNGARTKQQQLDSDLRTIDTLQEELKSLEAARERRHALEIAIKRRKAIDAAEDAERRLEDLPEALSQATGAEIDRADEYARTLEDVDQEISRIEAQAERTMAAVNKSPLKDQLNPVSFVDSLTVPLGAISDSEDRLRHIAEELEAATATAASAQSRVGGDVKTERLSGLRRDDLRELEKLAKRAQELLGRQAALDARLKSLSGRDESDIRREDERLQAAVRALSGWLQARSPVRLDSNLAVALLIACALVTISAVVLAVSQVWIALLAVLLAGAALVYGYIGLRRVNSDLAVDERRQHQDAFPSDVPPPSHWEHDPVEARFSELIESLERLASELRRAGDRATVESELEVLGDDKKAFNQEWEVCCDRMGLDSAESPLHVFELVHSVLTWRESNAEVEKLQKQREAVADSHANELTQLNVLLDGIIDGNVQDARRAREAVSGLRTVATELTQNRADAKTGGRRPSGAPQVATENA
jgi:hypothetical protein